MTGLLTTGLAVGCSAPTRPVVDVTSPTPTVSRTSRAQQVMDRAAKAILDGNEAALAAVVDRTDPSFPLAAETIMRNVVALAPSSLTITVTSSESSLSPTRARLLGPDVFVAESILAWRTPGQSGVSQATVWLTFTGTGTGLRWAGISDDPASPGWMPLWWITPVTVTRSGHVIVVAAESTTRPSDGSSFGPRIEPDWTRAAARAVDRVARLVPVRQAVLFEVPANLVQFGRAIGRSDSSVDRLSATTMAAGPDPATAATRIVVSPKTGQLSASERGLVLIHESVHAVLNSPATDLPLWLEEGTADAIAYHSYPKLAAAARKDLTAWLKGRQISEPPTDDEFAVGDGTVTQVYELAWSACAYIVAVRGWPVLLRLSSELSHDPRTAWWQLVGEPSEAAFVKKWMVWVGQPS